MIAMLLSVVRSQGSSWSGLLILIIGLFFVGLRLWMRYFNYREDCEAIRHRILAIQGTVTRIVEEPALYSGSGRSAQRIENRYFVELLDQYQVPWQVRLRSPCGAFGRSTEWFISAIGRMGPNGPEWAEPGHAHPFRHEPHVPHPGFRGGERPHVKPIFASVPEATASSPDSPRRRRRRE